LCVGHVRNRVAARVAARDGVLKARLGTADNRHGGASPCERACGCAADTSTAARNHGMMTCQRRQFRHASTTAKYFKFKGFSLQEAGRIVSKIL
jgi:hypothetical protein